jgi:hypothetical protein
LDLIVFLLRRLPAKWQPVLLSYSQSVIQKRSKACQHSEFAIHPAQVEKARLKSSKPKRTNHYGQFNKLLWRCYTHKEKNMSDNILRLLKNFSPKLISKKEGVVMVFFLFSKDFEKKRLR